jgi:hypothetical protein
MFFFIFTLIFTVLEREREIKYTVFVQQLYHNKRNLKIIVCMLFYQNYLILKPASRSLSHQESPRHNTTINKKHFFKKGCNDPQFFRIDPIPILLEISRSLIDHRSETNFLSVCIYSFSLLNYGLYISTDLFCI